jgi:hypothetical protein
MRRFVDEEKSPTWITGVAKTLIAVAREWTPVSAAQTAELKRLFSFLPKPRKGLTLKNRDMLRQLNDASTLRALLTLPQQLFAEARLVDPPTVSQAIQAQLAVAIEFLLICPVRAQNLISIRMGENLTGCARQGERSYVCFSRDEVKNRKPMMFELPPSLTKMLSIYVSGFLPIISQSSGGFIFCSINGGRKHQHTLSEQIQAVISDRLGLRVTPNQFRHIAAKVHMQSYPGDVEGVRWLLGHWS